MAERSLRVEIRGNARSFTASLQNASGHLRSFERQVLQTNARINASVRQTGAGAHAIGAGFAGAGAAVRRSGAGIVRTTQDINRQTALVGQNVSQMGARTRTATKNMSTGFNNASRHAGAMHGQFENYAGFIGFQMLGRQAIVMGAAIGIGFGLSVKAFADFEDSFALVRKTVDASEGQFTRLSQEIRDLATTVPIAVTELNEIAGIAGQLGVPTQNLRDFTTIIAELSVATNMTSEQAALSMARIAAVMQEDLGEEGVGRMSSALVDLGNNFAAREDEITRFAERIAAGGQVVGMATSDVLAFSTAFTSVGVRAERGGTAFQRVIFEMMNAVQSGGKELDLLAATAGMTAEQFAKAWRADPTLAVLDFVEGLDRAGEGANAIMVELFGNNVRTTQSFLALAGAGDLARRAVELGRDAWDENNARAKEAQERFGTLINRLKVLKNRITEVAIGIGGQLAPIVETVAEAAVNAFEAFGRLPGPVRDLMMILGAMSAVALIAAGSMALMVFPMNVLKGILPQIRAGWAGLVGGTEAYNAVALRNALNVNAQAGAVTNLSAAQVRLLASGAGVPGYFGQVRNLSVAAAGAIGRLAQATMGATLALAKALAPVVALYAAWRLLSWAHDKAEKDFVDISHAATTAAESLGYMLDEFENSVDKINTSGAVAKFRVDNKELLDSFAEMEDWQREHALVQIAFEMQQRGASVEEIAETIAMIQTASPYEIPFNVSLGDLDNPAAYLSRLGDTFKNILGEIGDTFMSEGSHQLRQQLDEIGRSLGMLFQSGDLTGFRTAWVRTLTQMNESGLHFTNATRQMSGGMRAMFNAMGLGATQAKEFELVFRTRLNQAMHDGATEAEALEVAMKTLAYQARENGMLDLAIDLLKASGATDLHTQETIAAIIAQRNSARAAEEVGTAAMGAASRVSMLGDSWEDVIEGADSATEELEIFYASVRSGISPIVGAARAMHDLESAQASQARAAADVRAAERTLETTRANAERLPREIARAERDLAAARRGTAADSDKITDAERRLEDERVRASRLPEDIRMAEMELSEIRSDSESTAEQILRAERRLEDLRREAQRAPEDLERAERDLTEAREGTPADVSKIEAAERKLEELRAEQAASSDEIAEAELGVEDARRAAATVIWDNIEANEKYNEGMLALVGALADGTVNSGTLSEMQTELAERFGYTNDEIGILSESFLDVIQRAIDTGGEFDALGGDVDILRGVFSMLGADSTLMAQLLSDNVAEAKVQVANILAAMGVDMETAMAGAETIFANGGEAAAVALLGKLATGGGDVSAILQEYLATITGNINPILEGLQQAPINPGGGSEFVIPGTTMRIRAQGGIDSLPQQATIQPATQNLVQWAEPETQGEAFIPLARSKRRRSIAILRKTAQLLGVDEQYVEGDIRGLHPNFLDQFRMWSQAEGPFSITSGFRSSAQQARLYARYKAGRGPVAAAPGRSKHEQGLAIDHAPHSWPIAATAGPFGLTHPVRSESWHVEPEWARGGGRGEEYQGLIGRPDLPDIPEFPHGGFFDSAPRIATAMREKAMEFMAEHMFATLDPLDFKSTPGADDIKNIAREKLRERGWEQFWPQFNALVSKESSWNPNAQNPTSTAYGLGQFLNSTWAGVGMQKTGNPEAQIEAMLRYIANRYGDPSAALRFHLANNWYKDGGFNGVQQFDNGGLLMPGATLAVNRTGSPEPISRSGDLPWRELHDAATAIEQAAKNLSGASEELRFGTTKHPIGGPNFNAVDPHVRNLLSSAVGADELATAIEDATAALEQWEKQIRALEEVDERKELLKGIQEARNAAKGVRDDPEAFARAKEREADAIRKLQDLDANRARENERKQVKVRLQRAEEELLIRRQIEANKEAFEFDQLSTTQQIAWLGYRMSAVRAWSDEWYAYYKQRKSLREEEQRDLEELAAQEARIEENRLQFAFDNMTTEQQIANLNRRIAAERQYSDEWMRLTQQRNNLAEQLHNEEQRRIDEAIAKRDSLLSELNSMLEQEKNLLAKMSQMQIDHDKKVKETIEARATALREWAKLDERVTITWGNRVRSIIGNVQAQIATMREHASAMTELRARGLDESVIEQLGLDDPRALGQVRMFLAATDAELAELNALVVERGAIATQKAHEEAAKAGTALAESLKHMKEEFNKALAEINEELQGIGQKHGLSYGEAIAAGMMSSLPAIQAAAAALNAAMNSSGLGSGQNEHPTANTTGNSTPLGWFHVEGKGWAQMVKTAKGYTSTAVEKFDSSGNLTYSGYKPSPPPEANIYDSGGILPPGLSMAYNGTRQAEYVLQPTRGFSQEQRPIHLSVYAITELDGKTVAKKVTEHQIEDERAILIRSGKSGAF